MEPLTKPQSNGNEQSFEHLYREHRADVYRFVLRDTGNPEEAEDVTQTAFLNAYNAYVRSGPPEKPKAWLFAIAQNVRRRGFRTQSRRPIETPLEEDPVAPNTNEDALSAQEISSALASLPLNQRSVVVLRELGGLTYSEISEELGLSVSAVQMLLFRARRALRAELEPARVPSRALGGLLPFPVPAWLSKVAAWLGSSFERTGVLTRAAGVVGAAIVGTGVVAGSDPGRALADLRTEPAARGQQASQGPAQATAKSGSSSDARRSAAAATRTSVATATVRESRRVRSAAPGRSTRRPRPGAQAPGASTATAGGGGAAESAASQAAASGDPKSSSKNSVLPDVKLPPALERIVPPSVPQLPDLPSLPPVPDLPDVPPLPPVPPLPQLPPPPAIPTSPVQPPSVPTVPVPPVSPPSLPPPPPPLPPVPPPPKLP